MHAFVPLRTKLGLLLFLGKLFSYHLFAFNWTAMHFFPFISDSFRSVCEIGCGNTLLYTVESLKMEPKLGIVEIRQVQVAIKIP